MLLHVNVTSEPNSYSEQQPKNQELFFKFFLWLIYPYEPNHQAMDPRDLFGSNNTIPLTKFSNDEELGGYENCSEWQVNVNSIKIATQALRAYELIYLMKHKGDIKSDLVHFYITVGSQT